MKLSDIKPKLMLLVLVALISVLTPVSSAGAVSLNVGFFSGDDAGEGVTGTDVLIGGVPDYEGDKEGFISFIEDKLSNGGEDSHDHIGAAFIVYTMLGYEPGGNDKNGPSRSEMDDWKKRIRNTGITIETRSVGSGINSMVFDDGGGLDAMFYSQNVSGSTLVFKYEGEDVYYLRLACANPIGDTPGLPEVAEWYIEGESYAKIGSSGTRKQGNDAITVKPTVSGNRVYWDHVVRNTGPDDMDRDIRVWVERRDWSLETNNWLNDNRDSSDWVELRRNRTYTESINHTITQSDVGKKLCQRVAWRDNAWDDDSIGHSDYACANVPYNFSLTPVLNTTGGDSEPGSEVRVNVSVDNNGPTKSRPAKWQLTEIIVDKGGSMPNNMAGGQSSQSPCVSPVGSSYFGQTKSGGNNSPGCQVVDSGDNVEFMPSGWTNPSIGPYNRPGGIPDLVAGSRICYALSVTPVSSSSSEWRHSRVTCYVISKKPKIQVWGNDIRAGVSGNANSNKVVTSITNKRGALYGSWAEYAIMAPGLVNSSSGAGLSGGASGRGPLNQRAYNDLTFTNNSSVFGNFGSLAPPRDPSAYFNSTNEADKLLDGHTLSSGETVVLNTSGNVEITGDIIYDGSASLGSLRDLPQAVIIADNIIIHNNVRRIDAWLIARNNLSTCEVGDLSDALNGINAFNCANPLRINGPITANHILLKRTAGGEASNPNEPAEVINLRPDAYMWGYHRSQDRGLIKTTYVRELPPRY